MSAIDFDPARDMRLQPNERVLVAYRRSGWPVMFTKIITLGLFTFWWRASVFVVTDQRVFMKVGILRKAEVSLPMRFIQDASTYRSLTRIAAVIVSTAGGRSGKTTLSPLSGSDARALSDAILEQAHKRWTSEPAESGPG